ncbi:MAG: hypothetical protein JW720_14200 [Sedimentisphaerales bacterium]|nr:hypothetical protein [Sedimentisphaerales bacterium]
MKTGANPTIGRVLLPLLFVLTPPVLSHAGQIPSSPYWKEEIVFPAEPFRAGGTLYGEPRWVKFTILTEPYDPNIVYFQDCREYKFHYNFAADLVTPFLGMTTQQFDAATLYATGQQGILGAVVMPPDTGWPPPPAYPEYGIQFVRCDPYTREEIVELFQTVKASVVADPAVQVFYFPTYEQTPVAEANRDWFESQGISISSSARWTQGNAIYSAGWAMGRLKYFEAHNITYAYQTGLLEPNDILLTDGVTAEVPLVAGIISLAPSTPNSHVAILAKTYGVPFVHLAVSEDIDRAWELLGQRLVLRAFEGWEQTDVRLIQIEGVLDETAIAEILELKRPADLEITLVAAFGAYSASTDGLGPSDVNHFGGKASNFGILRAAIPDNCPVAAAVSFDLWNEFLDQNLATGKTLREDIAERLSPYSYPPSDMAALSSRLGFIRSMFTADYITTFTQTQKDAVIAALQDPQYGFDQNRNIRFRSSSNVEDSNNFTAAGLYDSYSGCLADDLDGDTAGPCLCDPEENNERGVFRAIRKVFASFYNDNAYLERLLHGIDENTVGMAILVHHSFPDEIELANGVATLEKQYSSSCSINMVTQAGAVSVANPEDGSIPEEVRTYCSGSNVYPNLVRPSNLVPLGATVLQWQDEYVALADLLVAAADEFARITGKTQYTLDFEYKKVAPEGKLVVKQIREIPRAANTPSVPTFLISGSVEYCTFQGEYGTVFAAHRLKSRWSFDTKSLWLSRENLAETLYTDVTLEYKDRNRIRTIAGRIDEWPFAGHSLEDEYEEHWVRTLDSWLMHHLPNPTTIALNTTQIPTLVKTDENPILIYADLPEPYVQAEYAEPVPTRDYTGYTTTTSEAASLCRRPEPQEGDLLQHRSMELAEGSILIDTTFYWPPEPTGIVAGYTAPLVRWVETVITGYTTEPIVLQGWYSQTYRPEHHNFAENFIFEPQLEPGISPAILTELRARNIRMIYVYGQPVWNGEEYSYEAAEFAIYGFDDKSFLAADIDGDKDVDGIDFAKFGSNWNRAVCDDCDGADLTGDGCVTATDLWELAATWLDEIE